MSKTTKNITNKTDQKLISAHDHPAPHITVKTLLAWLATGDNRKLPDNQTYVSVDGSYTPWAIRIILLPLCIIDLLRRK